MFSTIFAATPPVPIVSCLDSSIGLLIRPLDAILAPIWLIGHTPTKVIAVKQIESWHPLLKTPHWVPSVFKINSKILKMTHKALHDLFTTLLCYPL